ncbi:hypothetical protein [Paenibacillus flagellatus]|nr:hypothetical protein [Paenibacillus flagellatus]
MPHHRRKAYKEQQNMSRLKEEVRTIQADKAKAYTASVNNIEKNLP